MECQYYIFIVTVFKSQTYEILENYFKLLKCLTHTICQNFQIYEVSFLAIIFHLRNDSSIVITVTEKNNETN